MNEQALQALAAVESALGELQTTRRVHEELARQCETIRAALEAASKAPPMDEDDQILRTVA